MIIAAAIFELNGEERMIEVAIDALKNIENTKDAYYIHRLTIAFEYLGKFKNDKINGLLEEYTKHDEYLVSYNAKRALQTPGYYFTDELPPDLL